MNGAEFVAHWKTLKDELLESFTAHNGTTEVASRIRNLGLSQHQLDQLHGVLDAALTDTMYALLLGLDGAASIGNDQQTFTITDEDGNVLESIEEQAWTCFHGPAA